MSEIFRTILIMSLSGSILALLLMAFKPLYRYRLHQSFQYYVWLVVLAVLLLPVSKLVQVPGALTIPVFQPYLYEMVTQNVRTSDELAEINTFAPADSAIGEPGQTGQLGQTGLSGQLGQSDQVGLIGQSDLSGQIGMSDQIEQAGQIGQTVQWVQSLSVILIETMIVIYPFGVILVLLYNLFTYIMFCAGLKRNSSLTSIPSPIPIYQSKMAQTPMLVGIFSPRIVLPKQEFTRFQLEGVLRHEMVHFRRKDILIKWLSVLTCAVHWFNPIVWLTCRQISRACELSCDEAVITGLDAEGRQMYGDTLILVAADDHSIRPTLAMGEDKRELKERLANIMKRKKHTRAAVTILVGLITLSAAAVTILGAESQVNEAEEQTDQVQTDQYLLGRDQSLGEADDPDVNSTETSSLEETTENLSTDPEAAAPDSTPGASDTIAADGEALVQTKNITMWIEGIQEEIPAFLATSSRYNYGIYLPFDFEFSEQTDGDWVIPTEASAAWQEIRMMIRPLEVDEMVPEDSQEGSLITQYKKVELPETTLLISFYFPLEAEEGGGARLGLIADTIFDLSYYQVVEEETALLSKRMMEFRILEARVSAFIMAYFGGDSPEIQRSLSSAYQGDIETYPNDNSLLVIGDIKGLYEQFESIPDLDQIEVSLEYKESVLDDSYQYLTIELGREGVDWKVASYGIER